MKRIFFDLDGPIIDVAPKFYQIYMDIFHKHGQATLSLQEYWELKRNRIPEPEIVQRTASAAFVQPYIEERLAVIENIEYLATDQVQEGVTNLLRRLQLEYVLTLVTLRNRRQTLNWELEHFQLGQYFEEILTRENNHGDHEIKVRLIRDYCGALHAEGILIGDTEADIRAAQELGLVACGVSFGIRSREYLERLKPDYIVDTVTEMEQVILKVMKT